MALVVGLRTLATDEAEIELIGPRQKSWNLPLVVLEPVFTAARDAARSAADCCLQHRYPCVLIGEITGQIDFERRLHVEERFRLFTHGDLRDLQGINELIAGELKAGR